MAKRKRRYNRIAKIKAQEPITKSEERKAFPKSLVTAFIAISKNKWNDESLYKKYVAKARDYLGDKYSDKIESGKLIVLLSRATSDLRNVKTKKKET